MDLRQLRYFSLVARLGSFSRAADALNLSQPALSKQIRTLEDHLGRRLLVRNGRGATLTEAGQNLLKHAQRILDMVETAESEVKGSGAGRFAIGLPFIIAATIGSQLIAKLRSVDPSANFSVIQGRSKFLMEQLSAGSLDVAIVFKPTPSPLVNVTHLVDEELFLMASPRAARSLSRHLPISVESLSELPLIAPTRPNSIRNTLEEAMRRVQKVPAFAMEIDNLETIIDMVSRDQGVAVLSKMARNLSARKADIVPLPLSPSLRTEVCLAVSSRTSLSQANRQLLDLTERIGKELLQAALEQQNAG